MKQNAFLLAAIAALLLGFDHTGAAAAAPHKVADYETCLELVQKDPVDAEKEAEAWRKEAKHDGAIVAATHCEALALSAQGKHEKAAYLFFDLAELMTGAPDSERAKVYAQAGDAWGLAGDYKQARRAFGYAIAREPDEPEYYVGRARQAALAGDWEAVRSDASEALARAPFTIDALVLRSISNRKLGYPRASEVDINHAAETAPHRLDVLLERGRVRAELGQVASARTDWQDVVRFAEATGHADAPEAQEARELLKSE